MITTPLTLVLGKGGVGKTTVARGLAALAQARGARGLVIEPGLGAGLSSPTGSPAGTDDGVHCVRIDEQRALLEAAGDIFGSPRLAQAVMSQFAVRRLAAVVPGLREVALLLAAMGHTTDARVVVDMPATGHGLAWLATVRLLRALAPTGRARALVEELAARLADPAWTQLVVVTLAEPLVAGETAELCAALPRRPDLIVVNAVHRPPPVDAGELARVAAVPALTAAAHELARWARPGGAPRRSVRRPASSRAPRPTHRRAGGAALAPAVAA